jgi:hypothetical protein
VRLVLCLHYRPFNPRLLQVGNRRQTTGIATNRITAMAVPDDPECLLTRALAAEALTEAGYRIARATLATLATRGGGPVYRRFGRVPLYRWGDLLEWAQSRLGPPIRSTSEADAA